MTKLKKKKKIGVYSLNEFDSHTVQKHKLLWNNSVGNKAHHCQLSNCIACGVKSSQISCQVISMLCKWFEIFKIVECFLDSFHIHSRILTSKIIGIFPSRVKLLLWYLFLLGKNISSNGISSPRKTSTDAYNINNAIKI